ncbi:MAG: CHAT domain-containing protein [Pyrinomonadaceae bacterium]
MEYVPFDLETFQYQKADNGVESFYIRVSDSPVLERQALSQADRVELPSDLRTRLRVLEKQDRRETTLSQIRAVGLDIGNALFPQRVRALLYASRRALTANERLRIRLMLDTNALADVPWEYAYLPDPDTEVAEDDRTGFIVFDRSLSFVRYKPLGGRRLSKPEPVQAPLRFVAFLSNPEGTVQLNLDAEEDNLKQALAEVPEIHPEVYRNPTVDTLTEALVKSADIFHFAGHGEFQGRMSENYGVLEGRGSLSFADKDNKEVPLPAETLALMLAQRGVRLAVLGACESSKVDQVNAWTGIAPALMRAGIPAVVGMQFKVLDENAITFSKIFYRALADGQYIDEAVTAGRLAIFARRPENERDWAGPVLYMREQGGVLFPKSATQGNNAISPAASAPSVSPGMVPPLAAAPPDASAGIDKRALREAIVRSFEIEDLQALCADVQAELENDGKSLLVNLEMGGGDGKRGKVLNLIQYLDNRGVLAYLVKAVREARPGLI